MNRLSDDRILTSQVLDIAFLGSALALVVTRDRAYLVNMSGDVSSAPLNVNPSFIIRDSDPGEERIILGTSRGFYIVEEGFGAKPVWVKKGEVKPIIERIVQQAGLHHAPSS